MYTNELGTTMEAPARRLVAAGIKRGAEPMTYLGAKIVDPVAARFVAFTGAGTPVWFNEYVDAVAFCEHWNLPTSKIHRTRPAGSY
ncbi:hypothetical protein ACWGHD_04425 [Streptomyces xanthophaeus]